VFIVAAVRLYREGVARLIRDDASLRLVGLGPPDDHSLRKIAAVAPRVVLVDVGETRIGTFVRRLAAATPGYGVIAIGIQEEDETVVECAEVGVRGYLERDASLTELAQAVRDLAKGELHCPPRIAAILFRNIGAAASRDRAGNALSHLTGREREIVGLIDRGLMNTKI
jgi:DNA-binding NarL/FixJ family response regulator